MKDIIINELRKRTMELPEGIEVVSNSELLSEGFKWIIENSSSNNLPYHNLNHLLTVVKYVNGALIHYDYPEDEKRDIILLAALFHDVNHSGGKETDDINVRNSIAAAAKFLSTQYSDEELNEGGDQRLIAEIKLVGNLLNATQYPYVIDKEDLTLEQGIIRDADLMQVFEYNWVHQNIMGLANELNLDFDKFIGGQRAFLEGAEFNTEYGIMMKNKHWDNVMSQFEMLEKIYK